MTKYKLIKKYPGSEEVGTIFEKEYHSLTYNLNGNYLIFLPKNEVENNPEFWEEVVAPDYEVTQVLYATAIRTLYNGGYRNYPEGIGFDLKYLLSNGGKIHSVKRLSDEKIFTVGDRIDIGGRNGMFFRTISMINISSDGTLVIDHEHGGLSNSKDIGIFHKIEPAPLDYEILSYLKKGSKTCTTTKKRGGARHNEFWNIYSVKRLSDGEIFKVGNVIKTYENGRPHVIDSITLYDKDNSFKQGIWIHYDSGSQHLSSTIKVKTKLLTTKDGVDIYVGDETWTLHKNSWYLSPKPTKHNNESWFQIDEPAHWSFSTKEKAKAYQLRYKPCLSLDDIQRATALPPKYWENLLLAAKSKL